MVDGQAEFGSLPFLFARITTTQTILSPLYAGMQPTSSVGHIAVAAKQPVSILKGRGANLIVVLLDREKQSICPGVWARAIAAEFTKRYSQNGLPNFTVVVKDSCYENWLIADTTAFVHMSKRFNLTQAEVRRISPNKADRVDAQVILSKIAQVRAYDKVDDAKGIMQFADPTRMAANSRSFRRFLRVIEHPLYLNQSSKPAKIT